MRPAGDRGIASGHAGFSLAETMIAATVGALVLGGALDMFVSHHQHYRGQQAKTELQQELRGGVHVLARELRLAGTGTLVGRPTMTVMAGEEVAFEANVNDVRGVLVTAAVAGQDWLQVGSRSGWRKAKGSSSADSRDAKNTCWRGTARQGIDPVRSAHARLSARQSCRDREPGPLLSESPRSRECQIDA